MSTSAAAAQEGKIKVLLRKLVTLSLCYRCLQVVTKSLRFEMTTRVHVVCRGRQSFGELFFFLAVVQISVITFLQLYTMRFRMPTRSSPFSLSNSGPHSDTTENHWCIGICCFFMALMGKRKQAIFLFCTSSWMPEKRGGIKLRIQSWKLHLWRKH